MPARTVAVPSLFAALFLTSITARAEEPARPPASAEPCDAARAAWRDEPVRARAIEIAKCELSANRPDRAAEALAPGERAPPDDGYEQTQAHQLFTTARARVAAVYVEADERDADVLVDGRNVGRTPLADPVFVVPGRHTIGAQVEGRAPVRRTIDAKAGATSGFVLRTAPLSRGAIGFDQVGNERDVTPHAASKSAPLLVAGAAGAAVALAAAIALNITANAEADAARSMQASIRQAGGSTLSCAGSSAAFALNCAALHHELALRDAYANVAIGGYVVAGLAAAATIAYAAWPEARTEHPATFARSSLHAAPLADSHTGGLQLTGVF